MRAAATFRRARPSACFSTPPTPAPPWCASRLATDRPRAPPPATSSRSKPTKWRRARSLCTAATDLIPSRPMTYREQVDEYLRRFGEAVNVAIPPLDGDGYTQIKRGSATVGINVLEDRGVLMFLSPMMPVPAGKREELYRYLLEKNFLATSDGAFAIDKDTDTVYLRSLRGLEGLDYEEFTDLIDTLGRVADQYDDELTSLFGKG